MPARVLRQRLVPALHAGEDRIGLQAHAGGKLVTTEAHEVVVRHVLHVLPAVAAGVHAEEHRSLGSPSLPLAGAPRAPQEQAPLHGGDEIPVAVQRVRELLLAISGMDQRR